jgi:hypothetical protein
MSSFSRDPVYPREHSLPEDFKNLIELVEHSQRRELAETQIEAEVAGFGLLVAPLIFRQLYRTVDHDLLFSSQTDLVMPDIKRVTNQFLQETKSETQSNQHFSWMVDIISREVRIFILGKRDVGTEE